MIKCFYTNRKRNFGDMLTPIILKWISGDEVCHVRSNSSGKVLCIGSDLNKRLRVKDIVWGYGSKQMSKYGRIQLADQAKFLSVRGKKTRQNVLECFPNVDVPEVYGDPALLMPLIYKPKPRHRKFKIGLVAHYIDQDRFHHVLNKDILKINILSNPLAIIDQINSCEVIISTSLHGLIVAEAYRVPVVWLSVGDKVMGAKFKFNDYFSGTGRDEEILPVDLSHKEVIKSKHIFAISDKRLAKPVIDVEPMIEAWRNYYGK